MAKLIRIFFITCSVALVWFITIGWGDGGCSGCCSDNESDMGGDTPEPYQTLHEKILEAADKRIHYNIQWTNRDGVWTVDGSTFHNHGLGYGFGVDDIDEFKASLDWQHQYNMLWSYYACALEPEDKATGGHRRPGGRRYGDADCRPLGGPNPCSEVDCNIPAGYEGSNCRWYWTGAECHVYVVYSLREADDRFSYLLPGTECKDLEPALINNGQGEIVDRFFAEVGDLVFMDYLNNELGPYDHVGILMYKGATIQEDCVYGSIGFYGDPFYYKACEASFLDHEEVLDDEWWYYCQRDGWGMHYERFHFFRLYE